VYTLLCVEEKEANCIMGNPFSKRCGCTYDRYDQATTSQLIARYVGDSDIALRAQAASVIGTGLKSTSEYDAYQRIDKIKEYQGVMLTNVLAQAQARGASERALEAIKHFWLHGMDSAQSKMSGATEYERSRVQRSDIDYSPYLRWYERYIELCTYIVRKYEEVVHLVDPPSYPTPALNALPETLPEPIPTILRLIKEEIFLIVNISAKNTIFWRFDRSGDNTMSHHSPDMENDQRDFWEIATTRDKSLLGQTLYAAISLQDTYARQVKNWLVRACAPNLIHCDTSRLSSHQKNLAINYLIILQKIAETLDKWFPEVSLLDISYYQQSLRSSESIAIILTSKLAELQGKQHHPIALKRGNAFSHASMAFEDDPDHDRKIQFRSSETDTLEERMKKAAVAAHTVKLRANAMHKNLTDAKSMVLGTRQPNQWYRPVQYWSKGSPFPAVTATLDDHEILFQEVQRAHDVLEGVEIGKSPKISPLVALTQLMLYLCNDVDLFTQAVQNDAALLQRHRQRMTSLAETFERLLTRYTTLDVVKTLRDYNKKSTYGIEQDIYNRMLTAKDRVVQTHNDLLRIRHELHF
jgi:hypothetical protein